jgi:hypothetical protein
MREILGAGCQVCPMRIAVERAVDRLLEETQSPLASNQRIAALLEQFDWIPDRPDASDPF